VDPPWRAPLAAHVFFGITGANGRRKRPAEITPRTVASQDVREGGAG